VPTVNVPADATNHSIDSLLRTADPTAYILSFGNVRLLSDGDGLKVGGQDMTSSDYDYLLNAEQSQEEGSIMLSNRYVRNDSGSAITLHIWNRPGD
jgi:hypothetical protein